MRSMTIQFRAALPKTLLIACGAAALLSACATKPEIIQEVPVAVALPEPVKAPAPRPEPIAQTQAPAPAPIPVAIVDSNAPIPGSQADFVYQSGGDSRIYFGYNEYTLTPSAIENLRAQAAWLQQYQAVTAVVEGNADERGTREYNLALAARRAESVKSYLVGQGVAGRRLTTVSYGKERPIDGRSSEDGWARNRNGNTNLMTGTVG